MEEENITQTLLENSLSSKFSKRKKRPATNATHSTISLTQATSTEELIKYHEETFDLWDVNDDLLLKEGVQNIGDYGKIAKTVKFSHKFTKEEIEARWIAILYHPHHSKEAAGRLAKLPINNKRVLWNDWEEEILKYEVMIKQQFHFQNILESYRSQFHSSRTAKSLEAHYYRMKRSSNLDLSDVPPPKRCPIPSETNPLFDNYSDHSDDEEMNISLSDPQNTITPKDIEEIGLNGNRLPLIPPFSFDPIPNNNNNNNDNNDNDNNININNNNNINNNINNYGDLRMKYLKKLKKEKEKITQLEMDISHQKCKSFQSSLALLYNNDFRYSIQSNKVIVGRSSATSTVDIDLSKQLGHKISRQQILITCNAKNEFKIRNIGSRLFFVNAKPLTKSQECKLLNMSLIELHTFSCIFEINRLAFVKQLTKDDSEKIL